MKYMQCTTCKKTIVVNNTGTCLQCQGFHNDEKKDVWQKNYCGVEGCCDSHYESMHKHGKLEDID